MVIDPARDGLCPAVPTAPAIDPDRRRDLFKTLGDNTRYTIYLELTRSPRPLTTAEIADTLGLHPNTVRPHLDRMRDAGLVVVEVGGRGEIGRPQHRYAPSPEAPAFGLEPPVMPVLARMVLSLAERLGAGPDDAASIGADEGALRAAPFRDAPSILAAIVSDLDQLGFDPVVVDTGTDPGTDPDIERMDVAEIGCEFDADVVVVFANCPFGDLVGPHPDLVCSLHRGMIAGFVREMGDAEVREFRTAVDRTPCQVTIGGCDRPSLRRDGSDHTPIQSTDRHRVDSKGRR